MFRFELAGGGIPGFEHTQKSSVLIGKNNQDGWLIHDTGDLSIALVADGCGSKQHSEVGSFLILRLLATALERSWASPGALELGFVERLQANLGAARHETLDSLEGLSKAMLPSHGPYGGRARYSDLVSEYLLCTVVGVLLTPEYAGFFSIGDGVVVINDELIELGPFSDNEPPYMAYSLLKTRWTEQELNFSILRVVSTDELESFLIGTDGVLHLRDSAEQTLPGSTDRIGPLSQFWREDRYFNKSGIRKRLARIQSRQPNYSVGGNVIEEARLRDDTTLIVGRKRKESSDV